MPPLNLPPTLPPTPTHLPSWVPLRRGNCHGQKSVEMKHKAGCGGDSGSASDSSGGLLARRADPERIRGSSRDAGCQINPAHAAAAAATATLPHTAFRLAV